jgi:tetratricopeptide (TPR) repeat protein
MKTQMAQNAPRADEFSSSDASHSAVARRAIFRKEGKYWRVGRGERTSGLRDTRGLRYIAHLLRYPHTEFHVLDLFGGIAGERDTDDGSLLTRSLPDRAEDLEKSGIHISGPSDAGEMLDHQAKAAYRSRLSELRDELEQAKRLGRVDRAEQVEEEIDALTRELSRAVGLGGRDRRAASASERARQSVTKAIKLALERIARSDPVLGEYLVRSIKTGNFCAYLPKSRSILAWEFADTLAESAQTPISNSDQLSVSPTRRSVRPILVEASPFSLAARTALIGREDEREAIRATIDQALSGRGSLVMLAGGPGAGKTRLAIEMIEYASRLGFRCGVGRCYERKEPFPYLPFVEIIESELAQAASLNDFRRRMGDNAAELAQLVPSLRRFFPDIPDPQELLPSQKRRYIFQSISALLARATRTRSYVYVLEDLHWADESTLALLIHLAQRISQLPVVLIGTYRDAYLDSSQTLIRTTEELIRMGIRPIKVSGLSEEAVGKMLNELSKHDTPRNLTEIIFDQTQGNPFFVEELYRHLLEENKIFDADGQLRTDITVDEIELPENVRLIIDRRLQRLNENEKRVLAAAAVIGRSFSFQLLAEISRMDMDQLFDVIEKAQRMGIIAASAEGPERPFTFSHELMRQTLLAGISLPRQQNFHAAVADAIERLHGRLLDERAQDIADHLIKAGPFADAKRLVLFLTLAGNRAIEAAAFQAAKSSFRMALSHLSEADAKQRADLLLGVAIAERGLERWEAAYAPLFEAFKTYVSIGDREKIASCGTELATLFLWGGRFQDATEVVHRALDCFDAKLSANRARLLGVLGKIQGARGKWEAACEAHTKALQGAAELCDSRLLARLFSERSIVHYNFLLVREAANDADLSRDCEMSLWERAVHAQIHYQILLLLGRMEEAAKSRNQAEALATRIGQSYSIARILISEAWLEFGESADLGKLETAIGQVLKSEFPVTFWEVFVNAQLSFLNFFRGDWSTARSYAQASNNAGEDTYIRGFGAGTLFRQMAYAGDRKGALTILHQKKDWLPRAGQPNTMGSWWMLMLAVEGLVVLGEKQLAAQYYPLACEVLETGAVTLWPIFRFTHTVAGMAAAAGHRWDVAKTHFQTALRQAEITPNHLEKAEIERFHALMLIDRGAPGDREEAQKLLEQAIAVYERIGMPRHHNLARALLERP